MEQTIQTNLSNRSESNSAIHDEECEKKKEDEKQKEKEKKDETQNELEKKKEKEIDTKAGPMGCNPILNQEAINHLNLVAKNYPTYIKPTPYTTVDALLIGSRAAACNHMLDRNIDSTTDWDIIASAAWTITNIIPNVDEMKLTVHPNNSFLKLLAVKKGGKDKYFTHDVTFDVEIVMDGQSSSALLMKWYPSFIDEYLPIGKGWPFPKIPVAMPYVLYVLKQSHVIWPRTDFNKTIQDLHAIKKRCDGIDHFKHVWIKNELDEDEKKEKEKETEEKKEREKERPKDVSLLMEIDIANLIQMRRTEHVKMYGKDPASHIKVGPNQTNEDFLETVPLFCRTYLKHDDLHQIVKFGEKPMYTKMQPDEKSAFCSEKLWNTFTHEEKIQDVQEEGMVLALERFLLPKETAIANVAYLEAVKMICTSVTKGWFRQFAIDHYPEVIDLPRSLEK